MIKINRQTDYAIRVILALGRAPLGERRSTAAIQAEMFIPKAFLTRIVADLARTGLIRTFPGRDGGLQLSRRLEEISLKDVIVAIEGPLEISTCMSEEAHCVLDTPCPVQGCWRRIQAALEKHLSAVTFDQFVETV